MNDLKETISETTKAVFKVYLKKEPEFLNGIMDLERLRREMANQPRAFKLPVNDKRKRNGYSPNPRR